MIGKWPCQNLMGGTGAAIYAPDENGLCDHAECEPPSNPESVKRPAMPIKSRLPDDINDAMTQAFVYAKELERVWAPKVIAYMDQQDKTIERLRGGTEERGGHLVRYSGQSRMPYADTCSGWV